MIRTADYKVMEVLSNGEWIKADVLKQLEDGTCLYIIGSKTSDGSYYMGGVVAGESCIELKRFTTETRVKEHSELIEVLIAEGYRPSASGAWYGSGVTFVASMFEYCGKKPHIYTFRPSWLEEVQVEIAE